MTSSRRIRVVTVLSMAPGAAKWTERKLSEKNACVHCGISFDTLRARDFSFNSPYGACPVCHGLGVMQVFDPDLVVPDPGKTLDNGAIAAWRGCGHREAIYRKGVLRAVAKHYGFDLRTPWNELPERIRGVIRCKNPRCITSTEQELHHIFKLTDRDKKIYRCLYCETKAGG